MRELQDTGVRHAEWVTGLTQSTDSGGQASWRHLSLLSTSVYKRTGFMSASSKHNQ